MTNDNYRYSRHAALQEIPPELEKNIHTATVCCVGAGGVASSFLEFIAAAGVKQLIIVDNDIVEVSNLHRQIIHSESAAANK